MVDTEFLLCNLRLIAEVVDRLTVSVWLVLPWVVVKELDALKVVLYDYVPALTCRCLMNIWATALVNASVI